LSFKNTQWTGSKGQNILHPKEDGHAWMRSALISQAWSFDLSKLLSQEKMGEINSCRRGQNYLSTESAMEIKYAMENQEQ